MSPNKENNWKDLKRPLVPIIARMVRSKALAPHDIIRIKMGAFSTNYCSHGEEQSIGAP